MRICRMAEKSPAATVAASKAGKGDFMPETTGKRIGFLLLQIAIGLWCVYDLWFAAEPGSAGTRIMNYVLLFCMVVTSAGMLITMARGQK